jgi:hypothetical protein
MADPLMDEQLILDQLRVEPGYENIAKLQAGALQALIDMYDRKMTRGEFMHCAASAVALYGQTSKLVMLGSVRQAFDCGDLDIARIVQAEGQLIDLIRRQSGTVAEIVERLRQCPTSQDAVH